MAKLLVIFGITGQQGGSVADYVLSDPDLSQRYKVRGVTRDVSKPVAETLKAKGAEIVQGDLSDAASLKEVLRGAHTVFAMTRSIYESDGKEREVALGKAVADGAVAAGASYFIYSTEWHAGQISGGKYPVTSYDGKNDVETYIRGLPLKSSFFAPGSFMQNFAGMLGPKPAGDGTYAISNIMAPDAKMPWIDVVDDSGKFVGAILAEPEKYAGKTFAASSELYSLDEAAAMLTKLTGKTCKYNQLPVETYRKYLPPGGAETIVNMFLFISDFGYYGPDTAKEVKWAAENARGKLTSLEKYFEKNPPNLA